MDVQSMSFRYNTNAVSQKQFDAHIKLYTGYVTKLNEIWRKLGHDGERKDSNSVYSHYRGLKKGETFALDSIILHEEYFGNMTEGGKAPGENTMRLINETFGSYNAFLEDFTACCMAARGWCITAYDQRTKRLINNLCDAHDDGVIIVSYPVIVMDMYEHAYFYDYQTNKKSYIDAFIQGLNWEVVEKRSIKLMAP